MNNQEATKAMKEYLHDYEWADFEESKDRVGLFLEWIKDTAECNPDCAEEIKLLTEWVKANRQLAYPIIMKWMKEEKGLHQEANDEDYYDQAWYDELAREAGNMYGMQGYHNFVGLDTSRDDEGCHYCGGNGRNCC